MPWSLYMLCKKDTSLKVQGYLHAWRKNKTFQEVLCFHAHNAITQVAWWKETCRNWTQVDCSHSDLLHQIMKNSDYLYSEGGMLVLRVENMWKWFGSVKCFTASWTGFVSYAMNDSQVLVEFFSQGWCCSSPSVHHRCCTISCKASKACVDYFFRDALTARLFNCMVWGKDPVYYSNLVSHCRKKPRDSWIYAHGIGTASSLKQWWLGCDSK